MEFLLVFINQGENENHECSLQLTAKQHTPLKKFVNGLKDVLSPRVIKG